MDGVLPFLVFACCLAAILAALALLASVVRRRGLAGTAITAALAAHDEAFRATAHQAHHELRAEGERRAVVPSPEGPFRRGRAPGRLPRQRTPRMRRGGRLR
ncbi:hypothetical protein [Streptomyces xiaopingdaonensis]|uniref:hypothetical protein n=1 Tax=Streptomyces xiaopingdaonensis TaxID=1565415 RepID=UPI0005240C96|nr:hypothetical protein [Streptomyces xiaopingdaonensis]